MKNLAGKYAIVTGAGKGIGAAIAKRFIEEEAAGVAILEYDLELAKKTAAELDPTGKKVIAIKCDVANDEQVKAAIEATVAAFGRIDCVINNAGIIRDRMFHKMTDDEWYAVINVNLNGVYNVCKYVIPMMREQQSGSIVNIASTSLMGNPGQANYAATKAALQGFTRSASRRMDAELCIISLCQPQLQLDAQSLNARLTRLEERIATGAFVAAPAVAQTPAREEDDDRPPMPDDADAPPDPEAPAAPPPTAADNSPAGFWPDLVAAVRQELRPPVSGFFNTTPNAPVKGILQGNTVVLLCANSFALDIINKPEILSLVGRKATALLGRPVAAKAVDKLAKPEASSRMQQLLDFGKAHSDIVNIKE